MSYSFDPAGPSVQAQLRRIAGEVLANALQTPKALAAPQEGGPQIGAAEVHALRKATKKLRGLLRLVKPRLGQFGPANLALRDAARLLAPLRDHEVMLATLASLEGRGGNAPDSVALHELLAARIAELRAPENLAHAAAGLRASLEPLQDQLADWRLKAKGFDALEPGLATSWRECRRGLKAARRAYERDEPAEPFHEWRKVVKHHGYHARLLQPIWPEMMAPHLEAAEALGELLGDHNDLDGLIGFLESAEHGLGAPAVERLLARARARRRKLARRALMEGERLFVDRPGALCARWRGWWEAARRQRR